MTDTQKLVVVALAAVGTHTVYKKSTAALMNTKFYRKHIYSK